MITTTVFGPEALDSLPFPRVTGTASLYNSNTSLQLIQP
jgi:hypothetical protein